MYPIRYVFVDDDDDDGIFRKGNSDPAQGPLISR